MSTSCINKILVCIYTCVKDLESVSELEKTEWFKDISSRSNFKIIKVLADEFLEEKYIFDKDTLTVKTKESYNNLCIKTYKMIEACKELFDFNYLLKVDGNIIKNRHNKTSLLFSFEYFLHKFYNEGVIGEYNGLTPIQGNTIKQFKNWASTKNLDVIPEDLISIIGEDKWPECYWAGSCYSLGLKSIDKILHQKNLFNLFKNLMAGCEDMAIASALK